MQFESIYSIVTFHLSQGFNYFFDDFGSKISVNFIGPFAKPTNETGDSIFISTQIGDSVHETQRFDIKRTGNDQITPDIFSFDVELDINQTMHANLNLSMQITTNANDGVIFQMFIDPYSLDTALGAICGGIILIMLNVLIITEVKPISNGFFIDKLKSMHTIHVEAH